MQRSIHGPLIATLLAIAALAALPAKACTVFTMQYALADMWISWGVRPSAVWGRGIGEWVAACVAGAFPLEDALRVTVQWADRMHRFPADGESVGEPLWGSLERVRFQQPAITIISPVTGEPATAQIATPGYWIRNHGDRANVAGAIRPAVSDRPTIFLEMGPATAAADDTAAGASRDHWQDLLSSLGELYVRGISIDWDQFDRGYHRRSVGLPTYAWQRQRFWYPTAGGDPADRADRVASLETPTLRALQVGNTAALAERLQETVALTDAERRLFPTVLEAVARQHRQPDQPLRGPPGQRFRRQACGLAPEQEGIARLVAQLVVALRARRLHGEHP